MGNFPFNSWSIQENAPNDIGVYYLGGLNQAGSLVAHYVGKAAGLSSVIRNRLLDHHNDVSHFGYRICGSALEASALESAEIKRLQPKYNKIGK